MFQRLSVTLLVSGTFSLPAMAQDHPSQPDPFLYTAQIILLILGMAFAGYWAYQSFNTQPIKLGDGPTLPRYMTQPSQFRFGVIAYVGVCLLVYSLIAYFHKELLPIVRAVAPDLHETITHSMTDGSLSYPLVVIFSAAIFITLLKIEKDWNPLCVLRRVVHNWVSIPQFANALMIMTRDELLVPVEERSKVAGDPDTPYITVGDFDKDRRSLDRQWAELCYIRLWLERHRAHGSHFTFFNEPSFAWGQLQADFDDTRYLIAPLKRGDVTDINIFANVAAKVSSLFRQYCRLAACFLVFKNQTQKNALSDAKRFGVTITPDIPRANPLRYAAVFAVAVVIAIYLGVSVTALIWDLLHGDIYAALNQDPNLVTQWIGYALAIYGAPILAVLLLRYLGWAIDPAQPNSYLVSYATVFLVGLCVSVTCLAIAIKLAGPSHLATISFFELVITRLKWSISPAIVSVYIAYQVDRQIDPLLPDISPFGRRQLVRRLMSCVFFGLLIAVFSALPAISITVSFTAWSVEKQRLIVLGTIFVIGLIMALIGEFCFKPKFAPAHKIARPSTISPLDVC